MEEQTTYEVERSSESASERNDEETKNLSALLSQRLLMQLNSSHIEYRPHPLDNPKATIKQSPEKGIGVFAHEKINPGELIAAFDPQYGQTFRAEDIQSLGWTWLIDRVVQNGPDSFALHHGLAEQINHSCDPNCGLVDGYRVPGLPDNAVAIVTRREIKPGEEICWDYAMSENSNWQMQDCKCGSPRCRGTVTAYRDLPEHIRSEYAPYTLNWIKEDTDPLQQTAEKPIPKARIETLYSPLDESAIREISDFFRLTFSNDWLNYVTCPPCDSTKPEGMRFSAKDVYANSGQDIPIEVIDFSPMIPDCPCCKEPMVLVMDPDKTHEKLRQKFLDKAIVTLLRDQDTAEILGISFGNVRTLREAFHSEEWGHPYAYTATQDPQYERDFNQFYQSIKERIDTSKSYQGPDITPDGQVFLYNCSITSPKIRRTGYLPIMLQNFMDSIPDDIKDNLAVIGEAEQGSRFQNIVKRAGLIEVPGSLSEHYTIMLGSLRTFADLISLPKEKFRRQPQEVTK